MLAIDGKAESFFKCEYPSIGGAASPYSLELVELL